MAWFENGGSRIYYEEGGAGQSLLLLPGWGGSIEELSQLRAALVQKFRVIAADLPGSGKSGPQPRTYSPAYYQEDAASFLSLLEEIEASPAHLVGFSDGGEYALLMASLRPDAIRSVVTWGAAGSLGDNIALTEAMTTIIDSPIPPMAPFAEYLKATYGEENARIMTRSAGKSLRTIMEAGGDISRSRAASIACPALLITGENDFLATPALVAEMSSAIPSATFVEAKGASHPVHHENPDWLTDTIVSWLSHETSRQE